MLNINDLSIKNLDKPKAFTLLNPFNGLEPLTDDNGDAIEFELYSLSSPTAQNAIADLKRNQKEDEKLDQPELLKRITESFSGEFVLNGKKVTLKNIKSFYQFIIDNEDYQWMFNQIMTFITKGDYSPKIEKD